MIAYLWPLLIVLFSGLLPGERLRAGHLAGAFLGFLGAAVLVVSRLGAGGGEATLGYMLAGACALTWAGYSVLSRRMAGVPTQAVAVFCTASAVLSWGAHWAIETPVWALSTTQWAAIIALGAGPVGLAFFVWDIGVKRGDIQLLGVAAYGAPLLSTLVLVVAGIAPATLILCLAAVLITSGAAIAARASGAAS